MGRKDWSDDKLLFRALNNKTEAGYWENIHALRMRPSQLLFEKCKQLINSKEQKNKKAGIDILAQLGASERPANSNMRCDSLKSLMIINKLSKFL